MKAVDSRDFAFRNQLRLGLQPVLDFVPRQ
jgi:hypothetical protein